MVSTYFKIGYVLFRQGDYDQAMNQKELAIKLKANGSEHHSTGVTYGALGTVLNEQGN